MSIVVPSGLNETGASATSLGEERLYSSTRRRTAQRRQTLFVQGLSFGVGAANLSIYAYIGTIPPIIPPVFFLSGLLVIGWFAALSESSISERFSDHHLAVFQVIAHVTIQVAFMLITPQIGLVFLNVIFLIFAVGALRMTSWQAGVAWTWTLAAVAAAFVLSPNSISLPMATLVERLSAAICFILTIGQCAFVGLYGDSMRRRLYNRSVELRNAYKRIEELAELDELTGAYNRRSILRMLEDEIARAQRNKSALSVALIDLDWFKRINDVFGHPTGDEVLRAFAITVFANLRSFDRFGRYGGEEFLLVLPGTASNEAAAVLDRQRAIISELDWSAFSDGLQVTISAGTATLLAGETADAILARADAALYLAKAQGRNCVASA